MLYLVDGHAVAYRQFFALDVNSFSTRDGEPTNAVFGFTRLLLDILQKDRPKYLAVSFDMGLSGRENLYGEYKGTRDKMPDPLVTQMARIQELVRAFNIPILAVEGFEADDIIGTVAGQAVGQGVQVRIITGDRDLLQLLEPHITVQLPSRGGPDEIYDTARFVERFSIRPDQFVDYKALVGDTSDNIPGVKGIGDKTATTLLQTYETLENIYAHLDEIKGANARKLADGRDAAYMSQRLARIMHDVPLALHLPDCVAHEFDADEVLKLFEVLNFRSLRDRLVKLTRPEQQNLFAEADFAEGADDGDDASEWDDFAPPARADSLVKTVIVRDADGLRALAETLAHAEAIVWDVETTGIDQMQADLVGVALAVDGETGYYVPVGHRDGVQLAMQTVMDALRPALINPNIPKYAHNATYDLVMMQRHGVEVAPVAFDTMIAEWMLDPLSRNLGLKNLVFSRLKDADGRPIMMTQIAELIGTGKKQITMDQVAIDLAAPYAAADAALTWRLVGLLRELLARDELLNLFETLEMPLVAVLAQMERAGVLLDVNFLAEMSARLAVELAEFERRIRAMAEVDSGFNLNSPKQLSELLFGKLGLPAKGIKKTKFGYYSTDAAVLEGLAAQHPIIREMLAYRELAKLKGTYVDALPALINPHTGRLHTSFNMTGASTGRLSSNNPNLQNIPMRTEVGRDVRRAFLAPTGKVLLAVDYSQVELRILAHISRDETLLEAFRQGQDIHAATAAAVYSVPLGEVTYEQRSFAKRVNFGLLYGMGAFRLARDSDLTLSEAEAFIKTYFQRLPGVQDYIADTKYKASLPEGLTTLMGRRRYFPALRDPRSSHNAKQAEERAAINMPIQGSAADIIKRAMIDLHREIRARGLGAQMLLQVHDELVLEVPEDEVEATRALVIAVMEGAYPLDPPLKANAAVGRNWRDMAG
jgi:DNA polymerase-1